MEVSIPFRSTLFLVLIMSGAFFGCTNGNPAELTEEVRLVVENEIRERLDEYGEAMTSKNLEVMLQFWSDADDFVFAGDGTILGGYDKWAAQMIQHDEETETWLHQAWHNVNVIALSPNAASATVEYDYSKITTKGDTVTAGGSWTYVFRKSEDTWKVIHSNGTHLDR